MFPLGSAAVIAASDLRETFRPAISVGDFSRSEILLHGTRITASEITGVVSTIPCFLPQEFYYITPEDREYVCAETMAFFIYFLSELSCKKMNPPSPRSISGPCLHPIEWFPIATACGVPVQPLRMKNGVRNCADLDRPPKMLKATIIDGVVVEAAMPVEIKEYLRILARAFQMPYLSCLFLEKVGGEYLLGDMNFVPDISAEENRKAIAAFLNPEAILSL